MIWPRAFAKLFPLYKRQHSREQVDVEKPRVGSGQSGCHDAKVCTRNPARGLLRTGRHRTYLQDRIVANSVHSTAACCSTAVFF